MNQASTPQTDTQSTSFPACGRVDLSHFGLIRVSGADTRKFLQGQLTNDVNAVTPERAQINSYCSPKGRMMASFWIFERDGALYLQMPKERIDAITKRLRMFVLRSEVTVEDASADFARVGLVGDCVNALDLPIPTDQARSATAADLTLLRLPGDRPRIELIGPAASIDAAMATVSNVEDGDPAWWALQDIRAGLPTVFDDTSEAFVPQMANLQLIDGISFTKGCYTGQEVVARMQYLGKLKRRMYRAHVDISERPLPGTELFAPGSASGQGTGRIVDAAPSESGGYEMLVVMEISSADAGDVRLNNADGPPLRLLELPYAFAADA